MQNTSLLFNNKLYKISVMDNFLILNNNLQNVYESLESFIILGLYIIYSRCNLMLKLDQKCATYVVFVIHCTCVFASNYWYWQTQNSLTLKPIFLCLSDLLFKLWSNTIILAASVIQFYVKQSETNHTYEVEQH